MIKDKIVRIALVKLLKGSMEDISLLYISEVTGLKMERLNEIFPSGNNEIIMDAVEYAGKQWIESIKEEINNTEDTKIKVRILSGGYALGSEEYPESLSVYIDLWKLIKDNKEPYIKERLKAIYLMYMQEFINIIKDICPVFVSEEELYAYSLFMTVLSDAIHIQSILLENEVNYKAIKKVIEKISLNYFQPK
jgi:hypothetical protein